MSIELGKTYKDKITGFQGACTGFVQYITGCNQALLVPKVDDNGAARDGCWFDEQRLETVDAERIVLDNGSTPGCDIAAPIR